MLEIDLKTVIFKTYRKKCFQGKYTLYRVENMVISLRALLTCDPFGRPFAHRHIRSDAPLVHSVLFVDRHHDDKAS